ncbi:hypothetical protein C3I27_03850 [Campylobacter jejuni]|uniref:Uncharacterized protein n=1 Tax=Campylobacter jejuni TaxID=197 RepID=A0AAX1Z5V5_CAMJU|nr:hypothetical protein [Campylobacter jejuni]RTI48561.1 hypothetical protein C3I27_03850 [Campylobacter jejuni]
MISVFLLKSCILRPNELSEGFSFRLNTVNPGISIVITIPTYVNHDSLDEKLQGLVGKLLALDAHTHKLPKGEKNTVALNRIATLTPIDPSTGIKLSEEAVSFPMVSLFEGGSIYDGERVTVLYSNSFEAQKGDIIRFSPGEELTLLINATSQKLIDSFDRVEEMNELEHLFNFEHVCKDSGKYTASISVQSLTKSLTKFEGRKSYVVLDIAQPWSETSYYLGEIDSRLIKNLKE